MEGTDLTTDVVEYQEPTDGMVLGKPIWEPSKLVFLHESVVEDDDSDKEFTLVDPKQVMWTSTTYVEEESSPSGDEEEENNSEESFEEVGSDSENETEDEEEEEQDDED